jgi:hypothetical protein
MRQVLSRSSGYVCTGRDQGQVLVEFAFALPIMALILIVVVNLGLIVREHQVVQNAAREGARFSCLQEYNIRVWPGGGSIPPLNPCTASPGDIDSHIKIQQIKQIVVDYCKQEGITISTADVGVDQCSQIPAGPLGMAAVGSEVTVTYNRQMLLIGYPILPLDTMTISGRSVFRNLY